MATSIERIPTTDSANISVIIPVYNRVATLRRTLDSVASQLVFPREIIIVDNNSTDGSMKLAAEFSAEFNGCPVIVTSCAKKGASAARNAGAAVASGEWLLFFDSDDVMYQSLISTYTEKIASDIVQRYKIIVVPQHSRGHDGSLSIVNHPLHGDAVVSQLLHAVISTNNMVLHRSVFYEIGGWNEDLPSWNDWELGLRLLLRYADSTLFMRSIKPQLCHILHENTITGVGYSHHLDECMAAIAAADADIASTSIQSRRLYELLLVYKRIMLAAQLKREGDCRAKTLRNAAIDALPSHFLHHIFSIIYCYIATGMPGGSRLALFAARYYLKLQ